MQKGLLMNPEIKKRLTEKQIEALSYLVSGYNYQMIQEALGLSRVELFVLLADIKKALHVETIEAAIYVAYHSEETVTLSKAEYDRLKEYERRYQSEQQVYGMGEGFYKLEDGRYYNPQTNVFLDNKDV